jgi:hypothetical protein
MIFVAGPFEEYEIPDKLFEGKGLHSLAMRDDIRQAVIDSGFDMNKGKFRATRRSSTSYQKKKFDALVLKTQTALISPTMDFLSQRARAAKMQQDATALGRERDRLAAMANSKSTKTNSKEPEARAYQNQLAKVKKLRKAANWKPPMSKTRWQNSIKKALRDGYAAAFDMGLESSGVTKVRAGVATMDREFVEKAVREEMRYFNRLIRQIDAGKVRGNMMNRLKAYSDALKHMYYAGRVMGTPKGMIIDWIAPMDRNTCGGCKFMFKHSPYTKQTLPTTPRAGDTPCLNRCRCRLVMRTVTPAQYESVDKGHLAKSTYSRKLSAIKSGKSL